jgi:phosphatidylserine/phosphatidylglycerophosphate/cardiolipin synthase-like enzyme
VDHVVARVQSAQHSIRFLTFSYTDDATGEAMIARHAAGVSVQGVFETRNARGTGSEYARLQEAGIDVLEDGNCYTMHHKVIIIDDATVITGSYNFTGRAENTNDENLVIIDNQELAAAYVEEFNRVYDQARNPTQCGR